MKKKEKGMPLHYKKLKMTLNRKLACLHLLLILLLHFFCPVILGNLVVSNSASHKISSEVKPEPRLKN